MKRKRELKILVINSDAIYCKENHHFIHKSTGTFIKKLKDLNYEPTIFHFLIPLENSSITSFDLDDNNISFVGLNRTSNKITSYFKASLKLYTLFKKADFIYCFYPNAFAYNLLLCKLCNIPYGLYLRGENNINSKLSRYLIKHSKFIATVSPQFTKSVKKYNTSAFTIAPMIDYNLKDIPLNNIKDTNENQIQSILFIGRVERDKGIFELIEAVSLLKKKGYENFILNIIGQGQHFDHIHEQIIKFEMQNIVNLVGVVSDKNELKKYYQNADLFILPTYHEGFPRVLYEAMIFKVPILTTFVGTISNLMQDGYNCYEIKAKDVNSIVLKLENILNDYKITYTITENATKTIKKYLKENSRSHEEIISDNIN
ncbi:glycosyltransferase [Flavimarina sp. Hel_I_48]|uniref:glycosyltransferase n=1 Tax=Flavimarina sp. Hel_I_48 TaxID=1392488 RepID=UPI0004DECD70|nr:glycosyltransferase [Flavimarina sp. Hel_I_48]